jgi:protein-disulfide isomerase
MTRRLRLARALSAAAAIAIVATIVSGCATTPATQGGGTASGTASGQLPTGTKGAVNFDTGAIVVGRGGTVIDTYIDPLCPYCGEFEKTNGAWLADQVNGGAVTLRIHALTFLDGSSEGSRYSSRASGALACVAVDQPDKTLAYLSALYADQPAEGTQGLSDKELVALAAQAGAPGAGSCITAGDYTGWADAVTQKAIKGPIDIDGASIKAISGTPTVLVGGKQYTGSLTDTASFQSFVGAQGGS